MLNHALSRSFAFLAVLCFTSAASAALIGEWGFDSQDFTNSGTTGATHDGTFVNEAGGNTFSTDTVTGSGYSLKIDPANSEFLQINNSASGDGSYAASFDGSTFTVSMWVKGDAAWSQWSEFGGKGAESGTGGTGDGWVLRARNFGGHAQDGVRLQSYTDGSTARDSDVTVDIRDQEWHLLTATYDGSDIDLYIDGVIEGSVTVGSAIADTATHPLVFGAREDGSRGADILIDSAQYYDTVLSANEIFDLANPIPEPTALALVGALFGLGVIARRR